MTSHSTAHPPTGPSRRPWRRSRLALALGLIFTSTVAAGGTATQADGDADPPPPPPPPPAISVTVETSVNHPGMMLVEWTVDQTVGGNLVPPNSNDAAYDAFRLQWSEVGSTSVSEAVIVRQSEPFTRLVIPNLAAGHHTVTVSGFPRNGVPWVATTSATSAAPVVAAGTPQCPGTGQTGVPTLVCMTLEKSDGRSDA
jgi:hypothetical protein